jgi:hypothetical protein
MNCLTNRLPYTRRKPATINKQVYYWWLLHALVVEEEHVGNKSQFLYLRPIKPVPYNADKITVTYQIHLRKQNTFMADPIAVRSKAWVSNLLTANGHASYCRMTRGVANEQITIIMWK